MFGVDSPIRSRLGSHRPAFYQRNIKSQKSGSEQSNEDRTPQISWRNGFPQWSLADNEIGVHPDENAAYEPRRVFTEVNRPPEMPEAIAQAFYSPCERNNEPASATEVIGKPR